MTVAELIERLQRADPDARVVCWDGEFMPSVCDAQAFVEPSGSVMIDAPGYGGTVL